MSILFLPLQMIWYLVSFIFKLTGRLIGAVLGLTIMILGLVLTVTVIGAIIGIPVIFLGLLLTIKALFG